MFAVNPAQSATTSDGFLTFAEINLSNLTYSINRTSGSVTGPSFGLVQEPAPTEKLAAYNNNSVQWALSGDKVAKFSGGQAVTGPWSSADPYFVSGGTGDWASGGSGFAGLRMWAGGSDYYYGWVSMSYDTSAKVATVSSFAFENVANTAVTAPVPEPSTWAAAALLFAGAAFARLRKRA